MNWGEREPMDQEPIIEATTGDISDPYVDRDGVVSDETSGAEPDIEDSTGVVDDNQAESRFVVGDTFSQIAELPEEQQFVAMVQVTVPLFSEPPVADRATITKGDGSTVSVPFTVEEAVAVIDVQQAFRDLLHMGVDRSGAARDLVVESVLYPIDNEDLIAVRSDTVLSMMLGAFRAQTIVDRYAGSAWEPRGEEAALFDRVIQLPVHLRHHGPNPTGGN